MAALLVPGTKNPREGEEWDSPQAERVLCPAEEGGNIAPLRSRLVASGDREH
jgi:hypothetical protein